MKPGVKKMPNHEPPAPAGTLAIVGSASIDRKGKRDGEFNHHPSYKPGGVVTIGGQEYQVMANKYGEPAGLKRIKRR